MDVDYAVPVPCANRPIVDPNLLIVFFSSGQHYKGVHNRLLVTVKKIAHLRYSPVLWLLSPESRQHRYQFIFLIRVSHNFGTGTHQPTPHPSPEPVLRIRIRNFAAFYSESKYNYGACFGVYFSNYLVIKNYFRVITDKTLESDKAHIFLPLQYSTRYFMAMKWKAQLRRSLPLNTLLFWKLLFGF
jgi:hypothetical protein